MGIFDSPREREATGSYQDLLKEIGGMQSSYGNINSINDIMNTFGMKKRSARDVNTTFNPARSNLATRLAMSRRAGAARMRGGNATPEVTFGNIESSYAPAFGDLESNAASTGLNVERGDEMNIANMLNEIFGKKDQFKMNKFGMKSNALGNYLGSLSGASTFDDLMALGSTASKFIKP